MKRKPTFLEALSTIVIMFLFISIGFIWLKLRVEVILIAAAIYAGFIGKRVGQSWRDMEIAISHKIATAIPAVLIILAVGMIIGSWMFSGTVPLLIYYGLKIISPKFFLVTAFLMTSVISVATGSSWGSAGTAGVALVGIASGLGIPIEQAVGAVVSGSIFGDKMSPLSETTNLAALTSGADLYKHIRHMLYTTVPPSIIALVVYLVVGLNSYGDTGNVDSMNVLLNGLDQMYSWSIIMLLPAVIILAGAVMQKPAVPIMILSVIVSLIIGVLYNGFDINDGVLAIVKGFDLNMVTSAGFNPANAAPEIMKLVNRGGMMSMMGIVLVIFCAYSYAGIVETSGCLDVILGFIASKIKNTGQLVLATALSTAAMLAASGNAYVPFVMVGEIFRKIYKERGLAPENLSRTLEDSGTQIAGLIPWGNSGIFYYGLFGITALEFGIWAIPCYLGVVFAVIYGFTGIGIKKLENYEVETVGIE